MKRFNEKKKILLILFYFLICTFPLFSQLQVSTALNPTQLVQNVLVGQGVVVSNVSYTGSPIARGSFTTGPLPTNMGFTNGVILASGNISTAIGPNTSGSAGTNLTLPGNTLLNSLINGTTYDAAVLSFDFVPVSDTIKFRYVFGSDEYPEFVNTTFNDVFGFFLSGINPLGGSYVNKNLAIIPNTISTPVSINNVNNGTANAGPCVNCQYYVNNTNGTTIQYDGFTTTLTAWALVIPCFTYHIKLAIADVGDGIYDSGVFLEANSFMSNSVTFKKHYSKPLIDTMAVEGCNNVTLTFKIPKPLTQNKPIYYGIQGTAINGVDYVTIPNFVTIPAGLDSVNLNIIPILDGIVEPTEFIRLVVNTSSCTYDTVNIYIKDNSALVVNKSNDTILCDGTAGLSVSASGGIQPYSYLWNTGAPTNTINVSPLVTTTYTVITSDKCDFKDTSNIIVKVSKPIGIVTPDTICEGHNGTVTAYANGGVYYLWNTGHLGTSLTASPKLTTTYSVIITDTLGCKDSVSTIIWVNQNPILTISNDTTICEGGSAILDVNGATYYNWNTGDTTSQLIVSPTITQAYLVTATSDEGCKSDTMTTVFVVPAPHAVITADSDTICKGKSTTLNASGGMNYLWNTGSTAPSISVSPRENTYYNLIAYNSIGTTVCSNSQDFTLIVKQCNTVFVPNVFTPNDDGLNDFFGPQGKLISIEFYEMYIFDRWGKLVYFTNDHTKPWDGKINGSKVMKQDTYVYFINIQETYNDLFNLKGTVHLIP